MNVRGEERSVRHFVLDAEGIAVENVGNLEVNGTERLARLNAPARTE